MMTPAAVFCLDDSSAARAAALAEDFGLPLVAGGSIAAKSSRERLRFFQDHLAALPALALLVSEDALQLALIEGQGVLAISAGFHGAGLDYRRAKGGGRSERIAKAVGLKGQKVPAVVDATAGLGVDASVAGSPCWSASPQWVRSCRMVWNVRVVMRRGAIPSWQRSWHACPWSGPTQPGI